MSQPERQWSATPNQLVAIVMVVIALFFAAGVVGRVFDLYGLKQDQAKEEQTRRELLAKIEAMKDELQYLQSDSFVEQEARRMLLWGRPGDKLIINANNGTPLQPTPAPPRKR